MRITQSEYAFVGLYQCLLCVFNFGYDPVSNAFQSHKSLGILGFCYTTLFFPYHEQIGGPQFSSRYNLCFLCIPSPNHLPSLSEVLIVFMRDINSR